MHIQENTTGRDVSLNETDVDFLYGILKQREKFEQDFSLPSLSDHKKHIQNNQYKGFKIFSCYGIDLGTVFLDQYNELGIYIDSSQIRNFLRKKKTKEKANLGPLFSYELLKSLDFPNFNCRALKDNNKAISATWSLALYSDMSLIYDVEKVWDEKYCRHIFTRR